MSRRLAAVCCLLAVCAGVASPALAASTPDAPTNGSTATNGSAASGDPSGRIVELYPNPVHDGDVGEFVVVETAGGENWTLSDGESTVAVPSSGRVALASDPEAARNLTDAPVVESALLLSNGGERLVLSRDGRVVDVVGYDSAPSGERWLRDADPHWRPRGFEPRPVVETGAADATTFVLPDAPRVPLETLRDADNRLLLAGYTFTSERAAAALRRANDRGVDVRVLVEGGPVGGVSKRQARLLDGLAAEGIDVRVVDGERARYSYHHAKYAVVDDSALVLTENWKPGGTGGHDSRGWGVRVDDAETADELAAVFETDAGWRDAKRWSEYRRSATFVAPEPASDSYAGEFDPNRVEVERVRLLTAPGNAEDAVVAELAEAEESIDVLQPSVGGPRQPFVRATTQAAERGVRVRLLLSGAWYVEEENRVVADRLNEWADSSDAPLSVRLADPRGRYGKVHAKGVVVDGETALVGSLNWNNHSARENREVVVALDGEEAAGYYAEVFAADWRASGDDESRPFPVGVGVAVVTAAALAAVVGAREIEFE
ncbi:phospholipase D-like domain-containing protein [Haloprofundus sp. MHR1]|uniref:phospholipase D-like domain-containing protein n=1 Tax=Haloprofundus sp. MHR1 TaxID=2572921 RepID=UPI0010BE3151|nr:phospholipase D-like domain-containing protein [Haloprofundus sp. MHR1]QCJ47879.1 phospholipase [Haloprofundus sp. MHR1]